MENMVPQIPNFAATPIKRAKKDVSDTNTTPSTISSDLLTMNNVDDKSPFINHLLGPLGGNIVESPPTPAPVYAAGMSI